MRDLHEIAERIVAALDEARRLAQELHETERVRFATLRGEDHHTSWRSALGLVEHQISTGESYLSRAREYFQLVAGQLGALAHDSEKRIQEGGEE
jgi:hypothetical protein